MLVHRELIPMLVDKPEMSSPDGSKGSGKGPDEELIAENVSLSRYTATSSSYPVTATMPLLFTGHTGPCARRYS